MAGARHFEELVCWQLSQELKLALYALAERHELRRDLRFLEQVRQAAASAPANIAEGFGRRSHADFARFLDVARGSLNESQNHILDGFDRGYLAASERDSLISLARRAAGAVAGLQRHLRRHPRPR
jgi:four helix bundle protein